MVLENTSNEITLVYSKAELSAPVDISFDLAGVLIIIRKNL